MHSPDFEFKAVFEPNDYLYFYENILTDRVTAREIKFLKDKLHLNRRKEVLDLACGYGRHANRIAGLGHRVTGMDISGGFLNVARQDAGKKRVSVTYLKRDMRRFSFRGVFDRVILLFTSFGYFDGPGNLKVLRNVSRALKPGGLFCFDMLNVASYLEDYDPYDLAEKEKDLMIDRFFFDDASRRLYNRRIVIRDGKRKDKPFSVRLYGTGEIRKLLSRAGLKITGLYGDWNAARLTSRSPRMIVVAKK